MCHVYWFYLNGCFGNNIKCWHWYTIKCVQVHPYVLETCTACIIAYAHMGGDLGGVREDRTPQHLMWGGQGCRGTPQLLTRVRVMASRVRAARVQRLREGQGRTVPPTFYVGGPEWSSPILLEWSPPSLGPSLRLYTVYGLRALFKNRWQ